MKSASCRATSVFCAALLLLLAALPMIPATAADSPLPNSPIQHVDRDLLLGFLADNDTLTLIDARSPEEFAEQHLPGAINVPFDAVDANATQLPDDKARPVVVYCRSGKRAGLLKETLAARGYTDVRVLPREQIFWEDDFMVFNCGTS